MFNSLRLSSELISVFFFRNCLFLKLKKIRSFLHRKYEKARLENPCKKQPPLVTVRQKPEKFSPTHFPLNFPNNLDARYREQSTTNIPLRLDWNTFTAPPPLFGQHPENNRLHNWALNRLQYRQDIHEDIRDHNIQILQQNSLQLKFEITVKLNNIAHHPYPLNPPNITAQSLPPPFIQAIETTNVIATLYSKARATIVIGYKFTATFSEKKVHCSQVSNGNKNRLDHESFYQSNIERLLHLNPEDCKNELRRLNITRNKNTDRKLVYFQVFSDSVHQAELERYQGHIKLDEKYPYNGAHGRLTYDIHDKHWIPHIGINNPSNCKADTKNKGYQEIMFFDWKIHLEKIQLTRDLSDNTMIYQGIRLPCKNDQGY